VVNSAFVPLIGFCAKAEIQHFKAQPSASREPLALKLILTIYYPFDNIVKQFANIIFIIFINVCQVE